MSFIFIFIAIFLVTSVGTFCALNYLFERHTRTTMLYSLLGKFKLTQNELKDFDFIYGKYLSKANRTYLRDKIKELSNKELK